MTSINTFGTASDGSAPGSGVEKAFQVRRAIEGARFLDHHREAHDLSMIFEDLCFEFGAPGVLESVKRLELESRLQSQRIRAFIENIPCSAHIVSADERTIICIER